MKIKQGDTVIVISGKDKGRSGKVLRALPRLERVLVEGVNMMKRHQKARRRGSQGQVVEIPTPIHISNVALKDEKTGIAARVGHVLEGEGDKKKKVRITRSRRLQA